MVKNKMNYVRILGGTTNSVQILNIGMEWNKG